MANKITVVVSLMAIAEHLNLTQAQTRAFSEAWCTILTTKTDLTIEQSTSWIQQSDYATEIKLIHAYLILDVIPKYFIEQYRATTVNISGRLLDDKENLMVYVAAHDE